MPRYVLGRFFQAFPLLLGVVTIVFVLIHLAPGDPVLALVGDFPAPEEYVRKVREEFGLDRPLIEQYVRYVGNLARGEFGYSFVQRRPVLQVIGERAAATALLTGTALVVATLLGVGLGLIAARRPSTVLDATVSGAAVVGFSVPVFWIGQLLILLFAVTLGWLPAQGMVSLRVGPTGWDRVLDVASHLVLPATALALRLVAMTTRLTRASLLEVLGQEFIRTAEAKGAGPRRVLGRHALPNALLPLVTFVGYNLGFLLAGSALIETVFGWPGVGRLLYDSVFTRDYPVLLGIFLTVSLSVVLANLLTDLLYAYLDPRIRHAR
ncbi:MAG: ABC transporter permease [Candidatus Rokubacteria bacterium]|nr:ABC transporter permease [Candidatus Rokubacteria bacterium]MBI2554233.1 ABC transporter permease [Candidatus Rokubacteria bacterium]